MTTDDLAIREYEFLRCFDLGLRNVVRTLDDFPNKAGVLRAQFCVLSQLPTFAFAPPKFTENAIAAVQNVVAGVQIFYDDLRRCEFFASALVNTSLEQQLLQRFRLLPSKINGHLRLAERAIADSEIQRALSLCQELMSTASKDFGDDLKRLAEECSAETSRLFPYGVTRFKVAIAFGICQSDDLDLFLMPLDKLADLVSQVGEMQPPNDNGLPSSPQRTQDKEVKHDNPAAHEPEPLTNIPPLTQDKEGKHDNPAAHEPEPLTNIPPLTQGNWVSCRQAAFIEGKETRSLATYRSQGHLSSDKLSGVDINGRQWRKSAAKNHPQYYCDSLKNKKKST